MNKHLVYFLLAAGFLVGCEKKPLPPLANERTIIVYINADNNLYDMPVGSERYGALADINEMELGWNNDEYRNTTLLVYLNSGNKNQPVIYRITHDENTKVIHSPVVQQYEKHDAATPAILSKVLDDAMQIAPAPHYGLVLWSHGTGWVPIGLGNPLKSPEISSYTFGSSNSYANNQMEVPDLARALPANVVFDYIAFDACYMGCIEVAYELRNHCRRFIASAVETPIDGFEYHKIMKELVTADTEGIVQQSYNHYSQQSGWWATMAMSSIDCSQLDALAAATKQLLVSNPKVLSGLLIDGVQDVGSSSTSRNLLKTYFDLHSFMKRNWTPSAEFTAFENALNSTVKIKLHLPKIMGIESLNTYSGFSCYVPKSSQPKALAAYRTQFAWSTASGMGALL